MTLPHVSAKVVRREEGQPLLDAGHYNGHRERAACPGHLD